MKLLRIIFRLGILGFIIISIGIIGFITFLENGGKDFISDQTKKSIKETIDKNPEIPKKFLDSYEVLYPNSLKQNFWRYALNHILNKNSKQKCPCKYLANYIEKGKIENHRGNLTGTMLGLQLEDFLTQQECLNFIINEHDFLYGIKGIHNASEFYFNKSFEELNYRELAEILIMLENPALYNKKRRPELYEKKTNEILEIITTHNNGYKSCGDCGK